MSVFDIIGEDCLELIIKYVGKYDVKTLRNISLIDKSFMMKTKEYIRNNESKCKTLYDTITRLNRVQYGNVNSFSTKYLLSKFDADIRNCLAKTLFVQLITNPDSDNGYYLDMIVEATDNIYGHNHLEINEMFRQLNGHDYQCSDIVRFLIEIRERYTRTYNNIYELEKCVVEKIANMKDKKALKLYLKHFNYLAGRNLECIIDAVDNRLVVNESFDKFVKSHTIVSINDAPGYCKRLGKCMVSTHTVGPYMTL